MINFWVQNIKSKLADCLSEVFEVWETERAVTRFVKYFTADVVNKHRAKEQASKVNDDSLRQGKNWCVTNPEIFRKMKRE
jgi:hypothetical protein